MGDWKHTYGTLLSFLWAVPRLIEPLHEGDLVQLDLLGFKIVVINSARVAKDLLDRRSASYSDRPHTTFVIELAEFGKSTALLKYAEPWKQQRKIIAHEFSNSSTISRYWSLQEHQARLLVNSLLKNPGQMRREVSMRLMLAVQLIAYGYPVTSPDDECLKLVTESLRDFTSAGKLGAYLEEETIKWAAISAVGAGLDTTLATTLGFFLAMMVNPEAQKKAQAEVDSVVGSERLPSITDRSSMPYVRSVFTEVLRWNPPLPLCLPHSTGKDDFYNGYHIPKDSIILPNIWFMTHDPEIYDEPLKFMPERYNNSDAEMKKVNELVFGFGRRTCPGMQFAEGAVFAIIATTLATCDILPELDDSGKPILPELNWSDGVISYVTLPVSER
ncbi:hypothetical protein EST38_g6407 [Candolleomyces aberdarensis]|uniref:Cytochrome P450 n=1 Tax=Candolleomyces aberdarensis TaxID=2316362 RepID=A0A4Q2DJS3_9AGAR|nr:hypothetical protein EST38_g6407 [Candolleomyces aberdarensis]